MCAKITLREKLKKEKRKEARHNTVKGRHPACHALERAGRSDSAHGRRGGQKSKRGGLKTCVSAREKEERRDFWRLWSSAHTFHPPLVFF